MPAKNRNVENVAMDLYNQYFRFEVDEDLGKLLGWNEDENRCYKQANEYLNYLFKHYIGGIIVKHIKEKYKNSTELNAIEREALDEYGLLPERCVEVQQKDRPAIFDSDSYENDKILDELKLIKVAAISSTFETELTLKHKGFGKHLQGGHQFLNLREDSFDHLGDLQGLILEFVKEPQKHMFAKRTMTGKRTTTRGLASDMVRHSLMNDINNNAGSLYMWNETYERNKGSYIYPRSKYSTTDLGTAYEQNRKEVEFVTTDDSVSDEYSKNLLGITHAFQQYTSTLNSIMEDRLRHSTEVARATAMGKIFKNVIDSRIGMVSLTGAVSVLAGALITGATIVGALTITGAAMLSGGIAAVCVIGIAAACYIHYRRKRKEKEGKYVEFQKEYDDLVNDINTGAEKMNRGDEEANNLVRTNLEKKIGDIVMAKADLENVKYQRNVEEPYLRLDIKSKPGMELDLTTILKNML